MAFKKLWLSEDVICNQAPIIDDITDTIVWAGGGAVAINLFVGSSDPEGHLYALTEINGAPVVNGSTIIDGLAQVDVIDVATGDITYTLALGATATVAFSYTVEDNYTPDPKESTATLRPIFGQCVANLFSAGNAPPDVLISNLSESNYMRGFVDENDNGTPDGSTGVIPNAGIATVPLVTLVNGSTFTIECYTDAGGANLCDTAKRKFPIPSIFEIVPAPGPDPYVLSFSNIGTDPYSIRYQANEDIFFVDIVITGGTYAGIYATESFIDGAFVGLSTLPAGLQALMSSGIQEITYDADLWNVEGATQIQTFLNVRHQYKTGGDLTSFGTVSVTFTP